MQQQLSYQFYISISSLAAFIIYALTDLEFASAIGLGFFIFFSLKFFFELGYLIEVRDVIILIALLQWIIGPILSYRIVKDDIFYGMEIPESEYMAFVLPASIAFIFGLYLPLWQSKIRTTDILDKIRELLYKYRNLDLILIGIGTVSALLEDFMPQSLRFAFYLTANVRFVGLFFLILNTRKYKWGIFGLVIGWFFITTLKDAMFHDLILWMGFLSMVLAFIFKPSIMQKSIILVVLFFGVFMIQSVKHEFRKLKTEIVDSDAQVFSELVTDRLSNSVLLFHEENLKATVTRINQGWIIAAIMNYTPRMTPFADGETIKEALFASFLPRFLAPNKVKAGGQENFMRFTGRYLREGTSMNLSILGEGYANFGIFGGGIFIFLVGAFYNFFYNYILQRTSINPTLLFWIPLLFLQVVKAEGDFAISLNHLVKSTIVVAGLFWAIPYFFKVKL